MGYPVWMWVVLAIMVLELLIIFVLYEQNLMLKNRIRWNEKMFAEQGDELRAAYDSFGGTRINIEAER